MKFSLPQLPYAYDALEPWLDAKTMEIHYSKHHQAYCDKFNAVLEKYPDLNYETAEEYLKNLNTLSVSDQDRTVIRNQGGGYVNHKIYWSLMAPEKETNSDLADEIKQTFGSLEKFKEEFNKLSIAHFASGWTWLVRDENKKLKIYTLSNQDSPYTLGHEPILTLDLWEHAYYLKYQNRRQEFVENWWNVVKIV